MRHRIGVPSIILLCGPLTTMALAQSGGTDLAQPESGQALSARAPIVLPDQKAVESWRTAVTRLPPPGSCAVMTFPSTTWQEGPCGAASTDISGRPPAATRSGRIVPLETSGSGLIAQVTGAMTSTSGSFYAQNVVNEVSSVGDTTANTWSLQINSNLIAASNVKLCGSSADGTCQGWAQFVYGVNPSGPTGHIQFWLINYKAKPGQSACPSASWNFYAGGNGTGSGCWMNTPEISPLPTVPITDLTNLAVTGSLPSSGKVTMQVSYGKAVYSLPVVDDPVGLSSGWTQSEFNIFGYRTILSSTGTPLVDIANINPKTGGAILSVFERVNGNPGALGAIECVIGGTTAETNNLTLTPSNLTPTQECSAGAANGVSEIAFSESNAPSVTAVSPASGPESGGTAVDVFGTGFIPSTPANQGVDNGTTFLFGINSGLATCDSTTHCRVSTPKASSADAVFITAYNFTSLASSLASTSGPIFTYAANPDGFLIPSSGPVTGGTRVNLRGTNLSLMPNGTQVLFLFSTGAVAVSGVTCGPDELDANTEDCSFVTPALSPAGTGPVVTAVQAVSGGLAGNVGVFTYGPVAKPPPRPVCHCGASKCCPTDDGLFICSPPQRQCPILQ